MTPTHYSAVLLDLDGTLLDTAPDFVTAISGVLATRGLPPLDEPQVRAAVTHGSAGLIASAFDLPADHPEFEPLRQLLLANYRNCLVERTRPFPGMIAVIKALVGAAIPWAIVTNKPLEYAHPIITQLPWPAPPGALVCPDHVSSTKPDPEPVLLACSLLAVDPHRALVVGDHQRDIESGRRAGSQTVAVSYGYTAADEDIAAWGADHIIDRADQLLDIVF